MSLLASRGENAITGAKPKLFRTDCHNWLACSLLFFEWLRKHLFGMTLSMYIPYKLTNTVFINTWVYIQQFMFFTVPFHMTLIISHRPDSLKFYNVLGTVKMGILFQDAICLCSVSVFFKTYSGTTRYFKCARLELTDIFKLHS